MSTRRYHLVVLVAPAHDCLNPVRIEARGRRVDPNSLRWILNPPDGFALEEALGVRDRIKDARVTVITMGPPASEEILRECLAAGANEAVRVWQEVMNGSDPFATAVVLASALRDEPFDLILCGDRRADLEHGQVGPTIAEFLGLPIITAVRRVRIDMQQGRLWVDKRLGGFLYRLSCTLPALITIDRGRPLRYPKLRDRLRASGARIAVRNLASLCLKEDDVGSMGSLTAVERFTPPKPTRRSSLASAAGRLSAAARLQRIISGGVEDKKEARIWECKDRARVQRVAEHIVREKLLVL